MKSLATLFFQLIRAILNQVTPGLINATDRIIDTQGLLTILHNVANDSQLLLDLTITVGKR